MKVWEVYLKTPGGNTVRKTVVARDLIGVQRALKDAWLITTVSMVSFTNNVDAMESRKGK